MSSSVDSKFTASKETVDLVKELSILSPYKTVLAAISDYATIASIIYLCESYWSIPMYLFSILVIVSRAHSLGILSHDVVHKRFTDNRKLGDIFGNFFLAWPLYHTTPGFRSMHLRHHSKLNTQEDPDLVRRQGKSDWQYPMSKSKLIRVLIMDGTGLNVWQNIKKLFLPASDKKLKKDFVSLPKWYFPVMALYYLALFSVFTYYGVWQQVLIYWMIPFGTWFKLVKRFRATAEHFAIPQGKYNQYTRTVIANPIERYFMSGRNINYHIEHHHYPSVPWYNLPKLHKHLVSNGELQQMGHITYGYFTGLMRECMNDCALNREDALNRENDIVFS